jgi:DNA damage-binding protein 1
MDCGTSSRVIFVTICLSLQPCTIHTPTHPCKLNSLPLKDVIIAKSNRLEIRQYQSSTNPNDDNNNNNNNNSDLLPLLLTLPINGRITSLAPIKYSSSNTDCLFFTTERGCYALISYDEQLAQLQFNAVTSTTSSTGGEETKDHDDSAIIGLHYPIQTHATGSFASYSSSVIAGGCQAECGPIMTVDPLNRCIALHVYDGWVTVIPINRGYDVGSARASSSSSRGGKPRGLSTGPFGDAFHARLEERTLLSMTFLRPKSNAGGRGNSGGGVSSYYHPQLVVLHQDARGFQHVITHGVDLAKKGLVLHGSPNDSAVATMMGVKSDEGKMPSSTMPPANERLKKSRIDGGSAALIAIPPSKTSALGGVLILGQRQITYHHTGEGITRTLPIGSSLLYSYCLVADKDADRNINNNAPVLKYILGDSTGRIHLLTILLNVTPEGKGDGCVTTLLMETLGTASSASAVVYLGKGCLFVGSQFGDSQLLKILDAPVPLSGGGDDEGEEKNPLEETTYLRLLDEYTNLGPIVDFDLRPCSDATSGGHGNAKNDSKSRDQHRQSLVVTCSGVGKDGTVRLVRNGVGMREHAEVEMPGIKGMWSLRRTFADEDDSFLVQSFVRETRILGVQSGGEAEMEEEDDEDQEEGGALAEVTIPGFSSSKSTLFAGNLLVGSSDLLLQVVEDSVRLVNSETLELVTEWSPFSNDNEGSDDDEPLGFITVASANSSGQIVVALRGGTLVYLVVEGDASPSIRRLKRVTLDREISCIDLNPFDDTAVGGNTMDVDGGHHSKLVAVGLWDDFSVRLLDLSSSHSVLDQVLQINLGVGNDNGGGKSAEEDDDELGESSQHMMARSLCLVTLDSHSSNSSSLINKKSDSFTGGNKVDMLLVGLGDGKLISFAVVHSAASSKKWFVHSRKEVSLGTQGIHLIPMSSGSNGTCVLATGDRPTVVYLTGGNGGGNSNPKLCYSTISLTVEDDDDEDGHASHRNVSVNVASSFRSSLLFSSSNSTSNHNYSLCVADETTLRLGMIDDIQKLHVTSYKLGMTPRRIAYHEAGRVYCVGCIDGNAKGGNNNQVGAEINMGNCVRFFDDSTFEEINQ